MSKFYLDFYARSQGVDHIMLHDPSCLVAIIHPELFTYDKGPIVVALDGSMRGRTLQDPQTRAFGFKASVFVFAHTPRAARLPDGPDVFQTFPEI